MSTLPTAVVLLSGGLDSTTTLAIARSEGFEPAGITFQYGQRHQIETMQPEDIAWLSTLGLVDEEPDRYTPHCDGQCDGLRHKHGTRMATMVIYCTVPEGGGHTNFQNAAVHVKPTVGEAIFFSYIDPHTKQTDFGLTSHSGCPVYMGEKKIAVQWLRYGVDAENPWTNLNTRKCCLRGPGFPSMTLPPAHTILFVLSSGR